MIISKDLFIFGEHIFGTIIPENTGNITTATENAATSQSTPPPAVTIGKTQLQHQQQQQSLQHLHQYSQDNSGNNTINVSKPILSSSPMTSEDNVKREELNIATTIAEKSTIKTTVKNQILAKQEIVDAIVGATNEKPTTTKDIQRIIDEIESRENNLKFKQLCNTPSSSCSSSLQPVNLPHSSPVAKTKTMEGEHNRAHLLHTNEQGSPPSKKKTLYATEKSKLLLLRETLQQSQIVQQQRQQQQQQVASSDDIVNSSIQQSRPFIEPSPPPMPQLQDQTIVGSERTKSFNNHNHHHRSCSVDNIMLNKNSRNESVAVAIPFVTEPQRTLQLSFQNITVLHNDRKILDDVSGIVSPGEVLAIMGPSGSGKTTLLDCLSGQRRIDRGTIYVNRETLSKKWRRKICYVLQEEIFFSGLTLRETVMYTALLRLPEKIPKSEKVKLVDSILQSLELKFCQNTKFGDYMNRGLSGGEKKRANIACELLTTPLLMLLDEPTSGLDSHSAISLMKILKRYAIHEQKTVVITVHQPSSQMFHMFDKLLLLYNGCTAYFGEVNNIYRYFEDIGVMIKPHYNPAEFVLEQLKSSPDIREKLFVAAKESHGNFLNRNFITQSGFINGHLGKFTTTKGSISPIDISDKKCTQHDVLINDILSSYYKDLHTNNSHHHQHEHDLDPDHNHHDESSSCEEATQQLWYGGGDSQSNFSTTSSSECRDYDWLDYPTRFSTQFCVLSSRNFKEAKSRMLSKLNWFQTVGLALMAGAIWFNIPRSEEYLHDLQGWMFFSQTYWMLFALFGALNSFPSEREVINKERRSGSYRLSAYYLAKMVGELPLVVTLPTVYLMISYPMLGCHSLKLFFLMLIFLLLNTIVAQSVGFFIGACCMDMNVSITLSALYTLATQLFGGYLSTRIPDFLSWIRYTSMIHYAYQNMQILEFSEGPPIECSQPSSYEVCKNNNTNFIPYEEILKAQNSTSPLWVNTLVLMMFFLVFRVLGYTVLRYIRCPKT